MDKKERDPIEEKLSILARKSGTDPKIVKEAYDKKLKEVQAAFELSDKEAKELALTQTNMYLKKKLLARGEEMEVLFITPDGNPVDWAKNERIKIDAKIAEVGKEQAIELGIINSEGKYFFGDDAPKFKQGKEVPASDVVNRYLIGIKVDGEMELTRLSVKERRAVQRVEEVGHKMCMITALKSKTKDEYYLTDNTIEVVSDEVDINEIVTPILKKYDYPFDEIVDKAETKDLTNEEKRVFLNGYPVISIGENIGKNSSTVVRLSTPDFDKYAQISVWFPQGTPLDAIEGLPFNVFGQVTSADVKNKSISVNGQFSWIDTKYKPKVAPQKVKDEDEDEKID